MGEFGSPPIVKFVLESVTTTSQLPESRITLLRQKPKRILSCSHGSKSIDNLRAIHCRSLLLEFVIRLAPLLVICVSSSNLVPTGTRLITGWELAWREVFILYSNNRMEASRFLSPCWCTVHFYKYMPYCMLIALSSHEKIRVGIRSIVYESTSTRLRVLSYIVRE